MRAYSSEPVFDDLPLPDLTRLTPQVLVGTFEAWSNARGHARARGCDDTILLLNQCCGELDDIARRLDALLEDRGGRDGEAAQDPEVLQQALTHVPAAALMRYFKDGLRQWKPADLFQAIALIDDRCRYAVHVPDPTSVVDMYSSVIVFSSLDVERKFRAVLHRSRRPGKWEEPEISVDVSDGCEHVAIRLVDIWSKYHSAALNLLQTDAQKEAEDLPSDKVLARAEEWVQEAVAVGGQGWADSADALDIYLDPLEALVGELNGSIHDPGASIDGIEERTAAAGIGRDFGGWSLMELRWLASQLRQAKYGERITRAFHVNGAVDQTGLWNTLRRDLGMRMPDVVCPQAGRSRPVGQRRHSPDGTWSQAFASVLPSREAMRGPEYSLVETAPDLSSRTRRYELRCNHARADHPISYAIDFEAQTILIDGALSKMPDGTVDAFHKLMTN